MTPPVQKEPREQGVSDTWKNEAGTVPGMVRLPAATVTGSGAPCQNASTVQQGETLSQVSTGQHKEV